MFVSAIIIRFPEGFCCNISAMLTVKLFSTEHSVNINSVCNIQYNKLFTFTLHRLYLRQTMLFHISIILIFQSLPISARKNTKQKQIIFYFEVTANQMKANSLTTYYCLFCLHTVRLFVYHMVTIST